MLLKDNMNRLVVNVACVAGAKRGGGRGERGGKKGNPPLLFPFLPIPYPLPLSTPATQAMVNVF